MRNLAKKKIESTSICLSCHRRAKRSGDHQERGGHQAKRKPAEIKRVREGNPDRKEERTPGAATPFQGGESGPQDRFLWPRRRRASTAGTRRSSTGVQLAKNMNGPIGPEEQKRKSRDRWHHREEAKNVLRPFMEPRPTRCGAAGRKIDEERGGPPPGRPGSYRLRDPTLWR
jgi:hypothetical protein